MKKAERIQESFPNIKNKERFQEQYLNICSGLDVHFVKNADI